MNRRTRVSRATGLLMGAALMVSGAVLMTAPPVVQEAQAATATLPIEDSLQRPLDPAKWEWSGKGVLRTIDGGNHIADWTPQLMNVQWANTRVSHSGGGSSVDGDGVSNVSACSNGTTDWLCSAVYTSGKDSQWLTLTTDVPNAGDGTAGVLQYEEEIPSKLGVVVEYDQRLYRTNNGQKNGEFNGKEGAGDGIAVYLADSTAENQPGGFGAGLGYSSVANRGDSWCPAQAGVPGGFIGVGFDTFGNYQKAESQVGQTSDSPATRPTTVSGNNPNALNARLPQSIGLRGSGTVNPGYNMVPGNDNAAACDGDRRRAYGQTTAGDGNFYQGFITVITPKWTEGYPASDFIGKYESNGVWTSVGPGTDATQEFLDFYNVAGSPSNYVMWKIPATASPFYFIYQVTAEGAPNNGYPQGQSGNAGPISADSRMDNREATELTSSVGKMRGGYYWLDGTGNLSDLPSDDPNNAAAMNGAFLDNEYAKATMYRTVRVSFIPTADGKREILVQMTPKRYTSEDVCRLPDGTTVSNATTGLNASDDTCLSQGGSWQNANEPDFEAAGATSFTYLLGDSDLQTATPENFRLGFSASTGYAVDYHQIRNLSVRTPYQADLAVQKQVAFLAAPPAEGEGGTVPTGENGTEWNIQDTGVAGQYIAYQVVATNNGPAKMDQAYPATLTDGFVDETDVKVPFTNPDAVEWVATPTGNAKVCAAKGWNATAGKCYALDGDGEQIIDGSTYGNGWVGSPNTIKGTGPIDGADALRWYAPSLGGEELGDSDSRVTVVFTGQVRSDVGDGDGQIKLNTWYPNTARVAYNKDGGPVDQNPANDEATARMRVAPALRVDKFWKINGGDPIANDSTDLPDGFSTSLILTSDPSIPATGTPEFGVSYPLDLNEDGTAVVPSSVNVKEGPVTVGDGCVLTEQKVTKDNDTPKNDDLEPDGYNFDLSTNRALNSLEITNEVTCSTLTLAKEVDNTFAGTGDFAGANPDDWKLTATPGTGPAVIDEAPSTPASSNPMSTSTVTVPSGDYTLNEAWAHPNPGDEEEGEDEPPANISAAYTQAGLTCTPNTVTLTEDTVTVPDGTSVVCTFENAAKPGSVTWVKTDDSDDENPLAGSEWKLEGPTGFAEMTLTQATCTGVPPTSPSTAPYCTYVPNGKFKVDNLPWGAYTLTETKAPAGYVLDSEPLEFSIGSDKTNDNFTLEADLGNIPNKPAQGPTLPLTGGASSFIYLVLGLSLVGAAAGAEMIRRKKRGSGAHVA